MGKKSIVANLQSNFIIFDPHQHYKLICIIYQVWTIIPQEIWSNHQKGKMVKIKVLTGKGKFLVIDLANIGLRNDLKSPIASLWPNNIAQNTTSPLDCQMNFSVNWSKVNCILKSQTLTLRSNSSAKGHFSPRCVQTWNLFTKKPNFEN